MIDLQARPIIGLSGFTTGRGAPASLAVLRRRLSRREEFAEQTKLARMLGSYLDRGCTFWTSLENKPLSLVSGILQQRRGVKSGLPDVLVIWRGKLIFVELKSRSGLASQAQKQVRAELLAPVPCGGCTQRPRGDDGALPLERGVPPAWEPPPLEAWEGPFADPNQRLPQAPEVAAQRAAQRRWRERHPRRSAVSGL